MKKPIGIAFALIGMSLAALLLPACAPTLGPKYVKPDKVLDNVGVVYIYRPSKGIGGGVSYDVKANGKTITTLYNGGYYPYFANPGELEISATTESTSSVTLDVKPAQSYYVKGWVGIGFFIGRPHLLIVEKDVAEKEIVECKLIPELKEEDKENPKPAEEKK
jgi:hypothetical protein